MAPAGQSQPKLYDGSDLRVGIVHARWNPRIINSLLDGAKQALRAAGVREDNIVVQTVPGSYELPFAVQRLYSASQIQSSSSSAGGGLLASATDLLSSSASDLPSITATASDSAPSQAPFDAIIAIGVLIKGETMHFEYIAEATSHGLMRVQLDTGVPVVFGLLTVLNEEQGLMRAGIGGSGSDGHNHGADWGSAAVELAVKRRGWTKGEMVE
ncbi:6,7-dimethyl-8-ribityllumazine synthase [Trichodelitschia bisporula]|uniref:6,7-dimethyl-8-ribityllumazine synthase n=1 Tax=Trichodelitschia bisporula TaxID=703511 RepID=A0A6G1IBF0_9PEZI|nr:6,7-dimethyl-8-ribityllumazine synthase [Trichodelitschia bisporula]